MMPKAPKKRKETSMTCQICKMVSLDASVETTAIASIHLAYILP